jgi:hypothetical protein
MVGGGGWCSIAGHVAASASAAATTCNRKSIPRSDLSCVVSMQFRFAKVKELPDAGHALKIVECMWWRSIDSLGRTSPKDACWAH